MQEVIAHHVLLLILYSNLDIWFFLFFVFSFMWIWVVAALEDANKLSPYYQTVYTTLFRQPNYWLQIFFGAAIYVLPYYVWLKYKQLFMGDPQRDITYQRNFKKQQLDRRMKESTASLVSRKA